MRQQFLLTTLLLLLSGFLFAQEKVQRDLQRKFIEAKDGQTIELGKGRFDFTGSLWLDGKKNITIKGKGKDKTFLSFKGQVQGAEGVKVTNSEKIVLEGFTVEDAKGDCIKVQETDGITFRDVRAIWTGKPSKKNGAYGLYPVMCQNVLIEDCEAIGASDAGVYVGQSKNIIVRRNKAYHNVAGIEIENSLMADVYENEAYDNTGGLLVFDLPDLIQKKGGNVRVFNNHVHDNNLKNFAPKGNIVAKVPDGTGLLILATSHVEIFENRFVNNNSMNTGIISYYMTENPIKDKDYEPYPHHISIHNNYYEREYVRGTSRGRLGMMFRFKLKFGKDVPHIIYDGIEDDKEDAVTKICIVNNKQATFANIDAANNFKNISDDLSQFNCEIESLKPANITMASK
ncbi:parallel beta-helix domain-containing protein [Limibacter armeniacum]|uniref:parallel beta-helix domain-containing protein n=1 Tax=Limibacter armeniacum TaxID=466084 RepID=UPI002FE6A0F6